MEPIFVEYGVEVLHTKNLHDTDTPFKGWPTQKKRAFVAAICHKMHDFIPLGVSMSALKDMYAQRAKESDRKRTNPPYVFCFNILIDWLFTDIRVGKAAKIKTAWLLSWKLAMSTTAKPSAYSIKSTDV